MPTGRPPHRVSRAAAALVAAATLLGCLVGLGPGAGSATAAETSPRRMVSGWLPYWTADSSTDVVTANRDLFSDASPFWHSATSATTITAQATASTRADVVARLRAAGVRVVPAVTDGMPARGMAAVLTNPTARAQHVAALVALAVTNGYNGLDLDYEKFAFSDGSATWATTRPAWVAFVRELATALHARGKTLTVTTPVMYDADRDGSSGYWVYDWAGIAPYADRLRIMAYDYSVSRAGPIAPLPWVTKVVSFAVTQFPSWRIQLGIPTYGRDWVTAVAGVCPVDNAPARQALTAAGAEALAAAVRATPVWDAAQAERTFTYRKAYAGLTNTGAATTCTATRTVWYSDASAVQARTLLVARFRLAGVGFWTLGGEDRDQWALLRTYARVIAPLPSTTAASAQPVVTYGQRGVVTARVATARGLVAGAPVRLEALPYRASTWMGVANGVTDAAGYARLAHAPTRNTQYRVVALSAWDRAASVSAPVTSVVRPALTSSFRPTSVRAGGLVAVSGGAAPAVAGTRVQLVRVTGSGATVRYSLAAQGLVGADGRYTVTFLPPRGTFTYQVRVLATPYASYAYGPLVAVRAY